MASWGALTTVLPPSIMQSPVSPVMFGLKGVKVMPTSSKMYHNVALFWR